MTRKDVDKKFLEYMLLSARNPIETVKAYTYYAIVRAVGSFWWEPKTISKIESAKSDLAALNVLKRERLRNEEER
jgi:hypothetical protein